MRKLIFLALIVLLLATFALPLYAHSAVVYDDAGFLTDAEIAALSDACNCATDGVQFYVVTASWQMTSRSVMRRCGIDENKDSVVLVIDKTGSSYYYEMFTYNRADEMFSDSEVDEILDDSAVYGNIKAGKLVAGVEAFLGLCHDQVRDELAAQRAREAREPLMSVITGVVVAVLAGGGSALGVFLYYRRKLHGETYPLDRYANMNLTESHDRFVGSYVTRVRVQSSSGGGGRSGGASGGSRGRR